MTLFHDRSWTHETAKNSQGHVCLVEDNADLRTDLVRLLESSGYVVDAYESAEAFFQKDQSQFFGVIVSDMAMSGMSGLECQLALASKGINPPFIYISGESSKRQIISAMKNRTFDFLLKPFTTSELLGAIEKALVFATEFKKACSEREDLDKRIELLSPREREVFYLLIQGYCNQELVASLGISLSTAKQYKSEVMRKMRTKTLSELLVLANT